MLLVVDVGNTQTHLGTYDGDELVEHWRFATVRKSTADELGAALRNLLALRGLAFADIDASIVSSTVPRLRPEWGEAGALPRPRDARSSGRACAPACRSATTTRARSAPDRLVNAVAGFEKVGGACVVVDFGTAVTHDVVSEDGEYLGGVIFPGVEISLEALTERAAALPTIDLTPPRARARQVHGRRHPLRRPLRLRRAWSTGSSTRLRDEVGAADGDRHRRPRRRGRALLRGDRRGRRPAHARPGLRLIWERNQ